MRRLRSAIAVLVALGLLAGAAWLADGWVRSEVESRIETAVLAELPEIESGVEARLGGTFAIPQLVAGRLDDVTVTAPEAVVDGVALADVRIEATGVPIRGEQAIASVHATGTVPIETVLAAVERRVRLPDGVTLELHEGEIAAVANVLGVPLEAYVVLAAEPRAIVVDLDRLVLGGATVDPDDVPLDLDGLLSTVVDLEVLPPAVELTSVEVTPAGVVVELAGNDVEL